jgi:hypothetical protein
VIDASSASSPLDDAAAAAAADDDDDDEDDDDDADGPSELALEASSCISCSWFMPGEGCQMQPCASDSTL